MNPILFTKKQLAAYLGLSQRSIQRLYLAGKLPFVRMTSPGGRRPQIRFHQADVEAWIQSQRVMVSANL